MSCQQNALLIVDGDLVKKLAKKKCVAFFALVDVCAWLEIKMKVNLCRKDI